MMAKEISPMMKLYLKTKEQYEDCILLYRLGDFYEMFFEDAEKASKLLDLTLTGKNCGLTERAPMCGVPYHAVDTYVAKLIAAGQKVAICEQLSEPEKGKLVERDVVRVITPGTVIESDILEEKRSNYIASVCAGDKIGIAFCDISTGEFCASELAGTLAARDLQEILVSYKPAEIICDSDAFELSANLECVKAGYVPAFSKYDETAFDKKRAKEKTLNYFGVNTLEGFGLGGKNFAVNACGALLCYLDETQKRKLTHLTNIRFVDKSKYMSIDVKTRRNLELTVSYRENKRVGSLLWLLDKTETAMGARMLSDWVDRPLQKSAQINTRLDGVEELYKEFLTRSELVKALHGVYDIERLSSKLAYDAFSPKDCITLKNTLLKLPEIKRIVGKCQSKILKEIFSRIDLMTDVADLLERSIREDSAPMVIKDTDYIKKGYNAQLDELFELSGNGGKKLSELEEKERAATGIRTLKLGYNKIFGYYFEISNSLKDQAPSHFIRKQTLTTGERFVTEELKALEEKMMSAFEDKNKLQKQLFAEIRGKMLPYIPVMQQTAQALACLDCLISLAVVAQNNDYCRPQINTKNTTLCITDGRHPIVETYVKRDNFEPNDTLLDTEENRTMVITGPNMAGKSTFMRQVALITLMAHIGSFVPAKSAVVPIVDKIFTRVGASDDLAFNQSTFMVEMVEVANILNNATKDSLIILDEVGRGTSTFDGLSIAWAVMEYVSKNICAKTLFATHYHELTELEGKVSGLKNYRVNVKEYNGSVIFLHKIVRGGANKSFGIEVAKLAGVPQNVCERAKEIVTLLENSDIDYSLEGISADSVSKKSDKAAREVACILKDIDLERVSPIEAFDILNNLVKRVKENE
ncbi:MAG: DNA mismatch repair protein MutS [Corallococcus sp.]|nr:DNA mismatch repair protein MutS [Corallococcus sp.]MCM1359173.1 DNA mismatch repair protein MutS [Corallococcus sp.]MCM1394563.1 DNA mismatch repair protein MutS [Corallococcus sp.]